MALTLLIINCDEYERLSGLLSNAFRHRGEPFPCAENAGPVMDAWTAFKRSASSDVKAKPVVQVAA
jgi:hypothetical protein